MSQEGTFGSTPNNRSNINSLRRAVHQGDEGARKKLSTLGRIGGKVAAKRKIQKDEHVLNEMWKVAEERGDHLLPEDELPPFLSDSTPPRFRKRSFGTPPEETS